MTRKQATVIGAGIAGITSATALAQQGWVVRLHERQPEIRAVGAGIYLWDNGLFALEQTGAYDEATAGAHIAPGFEAHNASGRFLFTIPMNGTGQARCYTLLRDRLISSLLAAAKGAGVEIVTSSSAVAVAPNGTVVFDNGSTENSDLVVVADGVHSRLRDTLQLPYTRIRMSQGAARVMIPTSTDHVPAQDVGKHLELFSGRRRMLFTPCTPDEVYLAFTCDVTDNAIADSRLDLDQWLTCFPRMESALRSAAEKTVHWDTFEYVRLSRWSVGKVAIIGDAAHAQPPYLGQGGGTAMTNALALADAVSATTGDLAPQLDYWETKTRPGVESTQRMSYRMRLLNLIPDAVRSPLLELFGRTSALAESHLAATRNRPDTSSTQG